MGNVINKKESKFNIKITHLLYYLYKYYKLIKIFPSNILNIIFRQNAILSLHYFGWGIDEILHSAGRVGYQLLYVKSESFNEAVGYDVNLINETRSQHEIV